MLALIIQTVKKSKWSIVGYTLAAAVMVWLLVTIYPSISTQGEELRKAFESYPAAIFEAFGIDMEGFFATLEGYLGGEQYSMTWPIILIMLVASFGGGALAGEIERGTIGILLSQPLSRIKLFLGKYLAGLVVILTYVFASILVVVPAAEIYDVSYRFQNHLTLAILGSLFALALFGITMMFSAFFSERGKVTLFSAGLFMLMYFLNVLANLKESLVNLKYLSLFHYFDYGKALLENRIEPLTIAVLLGVGVIGTLVGLVWFNHRDIAAS